MVWFLIAIGYPDYHVIAFCLLIGCSSNHVGGI